MTVEDRSLCPSVPSSRIDKEVEQVYQTLGIRDRRLILRAINETIHETPNENGDYDIADVMMRLAGSRCDVTPPSYSNMTNKDNNKNKVVAFEQSAMPSQRLNTQQDSGILGGEVSQEEREYRRLLTIVENDSKNGSKRKRGDLWFADTLNPHELKRVDSWPVGLKNVGNTCWFNAVIQSLFHIPKFRRLILNYSPSKVLSANSVSALFVRELRKLFALMVASKRKYVDPSTVLEVLKESFVAGSEVAGADGQQQDVSEFQHKLLDWLEDAYRPPTDNSQGDQAAASVDGSRTNPMVELFYGEVVSEGTHEGKAFRNSESFGQFPVQVDGFKTLHDSLEAATAQGEIESVSDDVTLKSGQEQWFRRLPPLLTIELSRFQYDQSKRRPEKIHNKLSFPDTIYFDRYALQNRHVIRRKREDVKRIRESLVTLETKLHRFTHFGSRPHKYPLADALHATLEFVSSQSSAPDLPSPMETDVPSPEPRQSTSSDSVSETSGPTPRLCSAEERKVLERCLARWTHEVESDVKDLESQISDLQSQINQMYVDPSLQRLKYRLHAVLVHEGQAASGHYWAYVYSVPHHSWLKFNDITVQAKSWQDLERESTGGHENASAYCLMFVDDSHQLWLQEGHVQDVNSDFQDELPKDLLDHVSEHNARFHVELSEWDAEAIKRLEPEMMDADNVIRPSSSVTKDVVGTESYEQKNTRQKTNEPLMLTVIQEQVKVAANDVEVMATRLIQTNAQCSNDDFHRMLQVELERIEQEVLLPFSAGQPVLDKRINSMLHYLSAIDVSKTLRMRILADHFYFTTNEEAAFSSITVLAAVERKYMKEKSSEREENLYKGCYEQFSEFRQVIVFLVEGVRIYAIALRYITCALDRNEILTSQNERAGLDRSMMYAFRRQCVLRLSEAAATLLEQGELDEWEQQRASLQQNLLPVLTSLETSVDPSDEHVVEDVRKRWCCFLEQDLGMKLESFQEFLSQLLESSRSAKVRYPADKKFSLIDYSAVCRNYIEIKNYFVMNGELPSSLPT